MHCFFGLQLLKGIMWASLCIVGLTISVCKYAATNAHVVFSQQAWIFQARFCNAKPASSDSNLHLLWDIRKCRLKYHLLRPAGMAIMTGGKPPSFLFLYGKLLFSFCFRHWRITCTYEGTLLHSTFQAGTLKKSTSRVSQTQTRTRKSTTKVQSSTATA